MRRLWDWMGTVRAPFGKPWFTTTPGGRPIPNTWEGWSLIFGFVLWIFTTGPFVTSSSALGIAWLALSILAIVIGVWSKTQTRI
ncbi:MAG: hypothetical protein JWP16_2381 [Alphaproteobacteria bacterium]|nr:hypothetical protein [Alphaproteobacteria bacterium]